ncbi:hypothetical protein, partial [Pontibacter sp. HJ8]
LYTQDIYKTCLPAEEHSKSGIKWRLWEKVGGCLYICVVKTPFRHTVTLLLTLSILLGSVGVALSEQLCRITGLKESVMQKQPDGCCQEPASGSEEDDCCTTKLSFEKLEPVSSLKIFQLEAPVLFAVALKPLLLPGPTATTTDHRLLAYSDSAPPLYGRSLLHRLHTLIV